MATIYKQITMTAQGSTSGPLYDIYYSVDGVTYTLCPDGDNVLLPSVGSTAIVTVDSTANFIKAVNLHPGCEGNDVIVNFGGLTTTTTTSGPTTTTTQSPTTTTTIAPTTTTTTLGINCYIYSWACDNEYGVPCSLSWTNCDGTPGSDFVSNGSAGNQCARQGTFSISNASFPTEGASCSPTTTTTTAAPTTTTTATPTTTTTSTTTTVAPTTTTTTAAPSLVSGYKVYFDIGNSSSYPGSGTTVTNLGSGGSAMNGTLSGGTYSSSNGGVLNLTHSGRDKITFDTSISASFTTMAIAKHNGSSTSWGTSASYYQGMPSIRGTNGVIITGNVDGNTQTLALINYGGTWAVPSGNFIYPTDIAVFNSYAYTSNGSNEHKMYLNTDSPATSTNTYTRGDSGTITSYINYDPDNNGSEDLIFMAYLQYDRVLSAAEIAQNYTYFSSRF